MSTRKRKLIFCGWIVCWYSPSTGLMRRLFLTKRRAMDEWRQASSSPFCSHRDIFKCWREPVKGA